LKFGEAGLDSDGNRFALCPLECQVHGSTADGPGAVPESAWDRKQLSGMKLERPTLEVDGEAALNDQKCFVRIRMEVPVIWLGHRGNADYVVIRFSNWVIVIFGVIRGLGLKRDDLW
jgi:hypothetical protein